MRIITNRSKLENGLIFSDILNSRVKKREKATSVEQLFGDLSDCVFEGDLDLSTLNLNSLKGCPKEVRAGFFSIEDNPNLKTLDFFPEKLAAWDIIYIQDSLLEQLAKVDINIYKSSYIYLIGDLIANKDNVINFVVYLSEIRRLRGDFKFIHRGSFRNRSKTCSSLEELYQLYKRVGFDQIKLERALKLL